MAADQHLLNVTTYSSMCAGLVGCWPRSNGSNMFKQWFKIIEAAVETHTLVSQ